MKNIREMSGRLHQMMIALDNAGCSPELLQLIINSPGNKAAKEMVRAAANVVGYKLPDLRFAKKLLFEWEITIPENYMNDDFISFSERQNAKENGFRFSCIAGDREENKIEFRRGEKYIAEIYQVFEKISLEDAIAFLKSKKLLSPGGKGLALAYESENMPAIETFSEDNKQRLYAVNKYSDIIYSVSYFRPRDYLGEHHLGKFNTGEECRYFTCLLEENFQESEKFFLLGFRRIKN